MLPTYQPPARLWPEIQAQLEEKTALQAAIRELPRYAAPAKVWPRIVQALEEKRKAPSGSIRLLNRRIARPLAAAAAMVGVAFLAWWWAGAGPKETVSFAYAEVEMTAPDTSEDWNAEDVDFDRVLQQVDRSPVADRVTVERLKLELDELSEAREEVAAMLQRYGSDQKLLKEAARIERVRSKVIKELAAWI